MWLLRLGMLAPFRIRTEGPGPLQLKYSKLCNAPCKLHRTSLKIIYLFAQWIFVLWSSAQTSLRDLQLACSLDCDVSLIPRSAVNKYTDRQQTEVAPQPSEA